MSVPEPTMEKKSAPSASEYQLDVKQQPKQARMAGTGEKADRRPLDPPPIIQLRIRRPRPKGAPAVALTDDDFISPTLTHSLFCFASLIAEDNEDEMYLLDGSRTKHVTGSVVSSLFHLKDQSCFVFPDLSVRTEGRWRFKMSMYEIVDDGVHYCSSIITDTFTVYSSKRFPGMAQSTDMSRMFAGQGLRLRIRRPGAKNDEENNEPVRQDEPAQRQIAARPRDAPQSAAIVAASPSHPRVPALANPSSRKRPHTEEKSAPRIRSVSGGGDERQLGPPEGFGWRAGYAGPQSYAYPPNPQGPPEASWYARSRYPSQPYPYPPPPGARAYPPAGSSYPAPPSAFHPPEPVPPIRRAYASVDSPFGAPPPSSNHSRDFAGPNAIRLPSRTQGGSLPSLPSLLPHARVVSQDSHFSPNPPRPQYGSQLPPFLPTPSRSRSPDLWRGRYQSTPLSPTALARQAESSVRMEDEAEMETVVEELPAKTEEVKRSKGSLAMLLGEGAADVKALDSGESLFFDNPQTPVSLAT